MYRDMCVAVVVPAHNEELLVGTVVATAPELVDHIIVVDDASSDATSEAARKVDDPRLEVHRIHVRLDVRDETRAFAMLDAQDGMRAEILHRRNRPQAFALAVAHRKAEQVGPIHFVVACGRQRGSRDADVAGGVRGRGAPDRRRGRSDDPHPRAHAGRHAVV